MIGKTLFVFAFLGSLCVVGCGGGSTSDVSSGTQASPTITSVSVACAPTSIQTGQTSQCSATVMGTGAYSSAVTWSATGGTIASSGVFTATSAGNATITATSTEDSTKSGSATVTISVPPTITSVSVACAPTSIQTGQTSQCSATVTGTGAYSSAVTWSATGGTIASSGVFTATSAGNATITATSTEDSTKSGSATVTITVPNAITSVSITCSPSSILTGQTSPCSANVAGTGTFSTAVTWSATAGAITSSGVFSSAVIGTVTITAVSTQDTTKIGTAAVSVSGPNNQLGTLYDASSWASLSAFTANGTTPAITPQGLLFSGGEGTYTQSLDWNWATVLPMWAITATITAGDISGTSFGLGLGLRSVDTIDDFNAVGYVDLSNSATSGLVYVDELGNSMMLHVATSSSALSFSAGDTIQLTVSRNLDTITATAQDITTNSATVRVSYQNLFSYDTAYYISPNQGKFAVFNFGGTQTLTSLNIASQAATGADLVCVGDSKTVAYGPDTYATGWCTAIQSNFSTVVEAGAGDTSAQGLSTVPEIIALKPKAVILNIGRNDCCSSSTYTNYASIVSQLQGAGITVYHLLPLDENSGLDQTPLAAFITSTYPEANIVNANPDTSSFASGNVPSGWLSPDNVHPGPIFEQSIVQQVLQFLTPVPQQSNYAPGVAPTRRAQNLP